MRYGYSILLGELVNADLVEYGDCVDFQIVCPNCLEATFKKQRSIAESDVAHFFSHYKAASENQVCELRVASYTKEQVEAFNAISRGQHLSDFVALLPTLMMESLVPKRLHAEFIKHISSRLQLPAFKMLAVEMRDMFARGKEQYLDFVRQKFIEGGVAVDRKFTPFHVESQSRIAASFGDFFNTEQGHDILKWCIAFTIVARYYGAIDKSDDLHLLCSSFVWFSFEGHEKILEAIATHGNLSFSRTIANIKTSRVKWRGGSTDMSGYLGYKSDIMFRLTEFLIKIPYIELLRKRAGNKKLFKPQLQ
jgi:hypothetical protein